MRSCCEEAAATGKIPAPLVSSGPDAPATTVRVEIHEPSHPSDFLWGLLIGALLLAFLLAVWS